MGAFALLTMFAGCGGGEPALEDSAPPAISGEEEEPDRSYGDEGDPVLDDPEQDGYADDDDETDDTPMPEPPKAPPPIEAIFNSPELENAKGRHVLERALIALIEGAPTGSTIRGSWYHFSRAGVADAFVAAKARGVKVLLTMDGKLEREQPAITSKLRAALGKDLVLCSKSNGRSACLGSNINHNKFALFTSTGGASDVVWQSSANLTGGKMHNNAVVVRGNKLLFDTYLAYFNDLTKNPSSPNLSYGSTIDTGGGTKLYISPRDKGDIVRSILDNIDCEQGKSRVRVAMAFFRSDRGVKVADKLVELHKAKCDVEVLVTGSPGNILPEVTSTLKKGGVALRTYRAPTPELTGIHSKYLLIDSKYLGKPRKLVFTGSHNYEQSALRTNDEVLMRVDNPEVFAAFEKDYAAIRAQTN